ncbi:hypothetical protein LPB140_03945 [Sphingorhabdus lutea]|uniref:DUF4402 domain-containing protein n=1 Tax=Sphingorhabdus lutea TaxID=1913578 RepID=A0A1L3JAD9_9SPHN|nr:DUF4402 domain-containing protein [Sphingorhabdus lutea]APG62100.1 hypothetical protein LPB140_03945 [Sphingorhabdus lutea]
MDQKIKKCGALIAALIASFASMPAMADTQTGDSSAVIVRPLSFIKVNDLDFGAIIPATTAGTVTIAPDGTRSKTGNVVLVGNTHQPASFTGQGTFNQRVDISVGANSFFINGPGAPMRVRTITVGSTPTAILTTTPLRFRISAISGIFLFPVGATLEVGANQTPGKYTGTWNITLNYV